mgnify:CR=1 FL=1
MTLGLPGLADFGAPGATRRGHFALVVIANAVLRPLRAEPQLT